MTNLCSLKPLEEGEILHMSYLYFLVEGSINIKLKKNKKENVGTIEPLSLICLERFLSPDDPQFKDHKN